MSSSLPRHTRRAAAPTKASAPTTQPATNDEEFLTTQEVCKMLKCSKQVVLRLAHKGTIPSIRFSEKNFRYPKRMLLEALHKLHHRSS